MEDRYIEIEPYEEIVDRDEVFSTPSGSRSASPVSVDRSLPPAQSLSQGPSTSVYNTNLMTSVMRPDPRYELALQWHRKCRILRQSTPIRRRWQSQLEVTQCHSTGTIRKPGCNFLFAFHFHSNYGSVLHYFRDKARYWSKIEIFSYPLIFDAPVRGSPSDYCLSVWFGKTRMKGLTVKKSVTMCLPVLTECTNVTDRHTNTHRHRMASKTALEIENRSNRHLIQSRLQVTGYTGDRYCLLHVVVRGPGSFR